MTDGLDFGFSRGFLILTWKNRHCVSDRGASLLETAIAVPLLLIFFFGLVELGQLIREAMRLNQASYVAAALGSDREPNQTNANLAVQRARTAYRIMEGGNSDADLSRLTAGYGISEDGGVDSFFLNFQASTWYGRILSGNRSRQISYVGPVLGRTGTSLTLSPPSNPEHSYDCQGEAGAMNAARMESACESWSVRSVPEDDPGLGGGGGGRRDDVEDAGGR